MRAKIFSAFKDMLHNVSESTYFIVMNAMRVCWLRDGSDSNNEYCGLHHIDFYETIFSQTEQALNLTTPPQSRIEAVEVLKIALPQITDTERLDHLFGRAIFNLTLDPEEIRLASTKVLAAFLLHKERHPIIKIHLVKALQDNGMNANVFYAAWEGLASLLSQESDPQLLSDMLDQLLPKLNDETAEEEDRYVAWDALAALSKQVNNETNSILLNQVMTKLGYREGEKVPFNLIEPLITILDLIRDPKKGLSMIADINAALKDNPTWLRDLSEPTLIKIASFAFASTEVHDILYDNAGEMTLPADYLAAIGNVRDTIEALNMSAPRIGNR